MSDETLELGQLVADHEAAHDRAEATKAELNSSWNQHPAAFRVWLVGREAYSPENFGRKVLASFQAMGMPATAPPRVARYAVTPSWVTPWVR